MVRRNYRSKKRSYKQKISKRGGARHINSMRSDNHKGGSKKKQRGGFIRAGSNTLNVTNRQSGGFIRAGSRKFRRKRKKFNRIGGGGCGCAKYGGNL